VEPPHTVETKNTGGSTIVVSMAIVASIPARVSLHGIRLGDGGGPTLFNFESYEDISLAVKRDERIGFGGFFLPGSVNVQVGPLSSAYREALTDNPVLGLLDARVGEGAWAEFTIKVSQTVLKEETISISCEGPAEYKLRLAGFTVSEVGLINSASVAFMQILQPKSNMLLAQLDQTLSTGSVYHVRVWVQPVTFGINYWRIETSSGSSLETLSNTNDGLASGFRPVEFLKVAVAAPRSPPTSVIEIVISLGLPSGMAELREVMLLAPEGFLFPRPDCGSYCFPGTMFTGSQRQTAVLGIRSSVTQGQSSSSLRALVETPEATPKDATWILQARFVDFSVAGWGVAMGFPVRSANSGIYYAGVAGLRGTQVIFYFRTDTAGGANIVVRAPRGFVLHCLPGRTVRQITLPGPAPVCRDASDVSVAIDLNATLGAGEFAFAILADIPAAGRRLPAALDSNSTWSIVVRRADGAVANAAYRIPARVIRDIGVGHPVLSWSQSEANMPSLITIGFSLDTAITEVRAVLIVFPERVVHDIRADSDFEVFNSAFPTVAGAGRFDRSYASVVKVFVGGHLLTIPAGTYRFRFRVIIPTHFTARNIWHLALCGEPACLDPEGQNVLVSFPLSGFAIGERSVASLGPIGAVSSAYRPYCHALSATSFRAFAMFFLWSLCRSQSVF